MHRVLSAGIALALLGTPVDAIAQTVTLPAYNPVDNDAKVGQTIVDPGGTVTLSGNQQFVPGVAGGQDTTLGALDALGRIQSGKEWIGAARLNPGTQNFGVSVPDPITGGRRVVSAYNSANLVPLTPYTEASTVPDTVDVEDQQYLDARIGTVTSAGGRLNVAIGQPGAESGASTNAWTMAAKQSSLFFADGTGGAASDIEWTSSNRIIFIGQVAEPSVPQTFGVTFVSHYGGTFAVTTTDGASTTHTVTNDAELRAYNDFLIAQMQAGNLDPARYGALFALGYTSTTEQIVYGITADSPPDEVAQPIGNRIAMHLVGSNAHGHVAAGAMLEVQNANNGAVRAEGGASAVIDGTLATVHATGDGTALLLTGGSTGTNNGVINGNFFRNAAGLIINGQVGSNVVDVVAGSTFDNPGILNLATGATNGAGKSTGIRVGAGSVATNAGIVNVGVTGSRSNGSMDGVYVNDATARFTNTATGTIYIGRGPQTDPAAPSFDIAVNQGTLTTGINVPVAGSVTNLGRIAIGTFTQNAAGILVTSPTAVVNNAGIIDVGGRAAAVPRENVGLLVQNGGAEGGVTHSGTINLSGVNGTGIKALSTAGVASLVSSTGIINVAGGADPASGTRNYGVWAEGQGAATARADVRGAVNLLGEGAIGIHARGRATVDVTAGAAPAFASGTRQIGFFAFGNDAHINVNGGSTLDVSTAQSTLFRLDTGADFDGTGLTMRASGAQSIGILGSGTGSVLNTKNAVITVSGAAAQGVIAEGGANATIDAATTMSLTGAGAIAGIADGQKHALTGAATGSPLASTSLTSLAALDASQAGVIGYIARNGASLSNAGAMRFTGANATGFIVETGARGTNSATADLSGPAATGALLRSGGTFANDGSIHVGSGTGVRVEGAGTQRLNPAGSIAVDDGVAGVQLLDGAGLLLGAGDSAIVTRGGAHGVLLDTGATSLTANGTTIATLGSGSAIENAAEIAAITLSGATLRVGDGAGLRTATAIDPASTAAVDIEGRGTGYAFRREDGSVADGDLTVGPGFVIHANGPGATGIQALTTGAVVSAAAVDVRDVAGGSALVAGTSSSVTNGGMLMSSSTVSPVVDLANGGGTRFTNGGVIVAATPSAIAVRGAAGRDAIALASGVVRGDVATGDGGDTFAWTGGTLDGGLTMGDGAGNAATIGAVDTATTYHLMAGDGGGNTLTFDGTQARGGSFTADALARGINLGSGWNTIAFINGASFTLTDHLRLANSDVTIDASSTLFAGDGVHPVIAGATPGSASVANAGLIDLTNGSGSPGNSLTIDGNYAGGPGRLRLVGRLDAGGSLAAQATDRLLVQGDASGETRIDAFAATASTGAFTDTDASGYVAAGEGISIVQVAGASAGGAFRLDGGYLAFGPWQYGLYAFAPEASDVAQRVVGGSGGFWDYRLANVIVCDGPCPAPTTASPAPTPAAGAPYVAPAAGVAPLARVEARAAVVPQVPAYVVSPSALALYGYRTIDNLHRRLGEIRDAEGDEGLGGDTFVRYLGGDYHYATDRSFRDFGFDYDLDMRAVQVGANVFAVDAERSALRAGVAYTHGTTRLDPKAADGYSHAKFTSNSIAMFVTWQHRGGYYVDIVASGDRHRGDIDTARAKDVARLRGSGWTGSVETGYPFILDGGWRIEPQLQLVRQHIGLRDQTDRDATTTHYDAFEQTVGRAGLRIDRTWLTDSGDRATPYARMNYVRGWGGRPDVTVGAAGYDVSRRFAGGRFGRLLEFGLGGTYTWIRGLAIYGEADWQKNLGDAGARGWSANIGVRWTF
ncbi:autotransporter outer membrane beta-barrel domain-containing protein [Luteibacter sp. 3190]|uniref:autotransporter outer membrane beta-barrel domain-containing protein n=1 Tax=Luteibacter sp. 3190 TaxID=2817736 RepID=UPI002860A187|nr:autotransporter outer membrane beta-barrel domain-containing protein [Luteibacter sp. 3190]MDR6936201.1 outer membrane autotransporter protein [Luteibacter sp. 3190]